MNPRPTLAAALLLLGMIAVNRTYAQDDILVRVNQSLTSMQVALANRPYPPAEKPKSDSIQKDMTRISSLLNGLIACILKADTIEDRLYDGLLLEIKNYKELFDLAARSGDLDSIAAILGFVREDLNLKYNASLASATDVSGEFVNVQVRVLRDSTMKELPGYIAHVKPVWSVNKEQEEVFNATNNAVKDLVPGKKLFWIERNGTFIQDRVERIRIGTTNDTRIDFVVKP